MSRTITEYQVRVFEYAKSRVGTWFTIQELATEANIPAGSAKAQADRFQERGLLDLLKISPAQVYRMTEDSSARDPELVRRIEEAIPIFAQRRQGWVRREAAAMGIAATTLPSGTAHALPFTPSANRVDARMDVTPVSSSAAASPSPATVSAPRLSSATAVVPAQRPQVANSATRRPTKADELMDFLRRQEGASLDELVAHFGTQPHSVRALISVATRERGLKAQYENGRYRIASA